MSDSLDELQTIATRGGLFTRWQAWCAPSGRVIVSCQCGHDNGPQPRWCNFRACTPEDLAEAIDEVARIVIAYWHWQIPGGTLQHRLRP